MNKHIELVKKWLANKDSVTQEELEANAEAADAYANAVHGAAYINSSLFLPRNIGLTVTRN